MDTNTNTNTHATGAPYNMKEYERANKIKRKKKATTTHQPTNQRTNQPTIYMLIYIYRLNRETQSQCTMYVFIRMPELYRTTWWETVRTYQIIYTALASRAEYKCYCYCFALGTVFSSFVFVCLAVCCVCHCRCCYCCCCCCCHFFLFLFFCCSFVLCAFAR